MSSINIYWINFFSRSWFLCFLDSWKIKKSANVGLCFHMATTFRGLDVAGRQMRMHFPFGQGHHLPSSYASPAWPLFIGELWSLLGESWMEGDRTKSGFLTWHLGVGDRIDAMCLGIQLVSLVQGQASIAENCVRLTCWSMKKRGSRVWRKD